MEVLHHPQLPGDCQFKAICLTLDRQDLWTIGVTMFCGTCGTVQTTEFCSYCGARNGSASSFGSDKASPPIFERRTSDKQNFAQETVQELKLIGLGNLLPYKDWLIDKPWNLIWVRWFIGAALFPLFLVFWASTSQFEFHSVAFMFGLYFALLWAVVLYFLLLPRLAFNRIAQVGLFTMTVGIALALILQQLPFVSSLYSATNSASIVGRLIGFVLGVGIVEELTKALPIWWLYVHKRNEDSLSTIVFLGCISGFAFGVAEAVNYSLAYVLGFKFGMLGSGDYLLSQLTRLITLPLLHAVWAGTACYFVALASVNRHVSKGLLIAGLVIAATLHGLYDSFSSSVIGVPVAVLSVLLFISYYRSGQSLQTKIGSLLVDDTRPLV